MNNNPSSSKFIIPFAIVVVFLNIILLVMIQFQDILAPKVVPTVVLPEEIVSNVVSEPVSEPVN